MEATGIIPVAPVAPEKSHSYSVTETAKPDPAFQSFKWFQLNPEAGNRLPQFISQILKLVHILVSLLNRTH